LFDVEAAELVGAVGIGRRDQPRQPLHPLAKEPRHISGNQFAGHRFRQQRAAALLDIEPQEDQGPGDDVGIFEIQVVPRVEDPVEILLGLLLFVFSQIGVARRLPFLELGDEHEPGRPVADGPQLRGDLHDRFVDEVGVAVLAVRQQRGRLVPGLVIPQKHGEHRVLAGSAEFLADRGFIRLPGPARLLIRRFPRRGPGPGVGSCLASEPEVAGPEIVRIHRAGVGTCGHRKAPEKKPGAGIARSLDRRPEVD
jgi:hypothetical protein